jgi:sec-independent protein translocase protein TatA
MGLGGIGFTQLAIILVIVVMIFGTKRLRQAGGDIGGMIRGVKDGIKDADPVVEELTELGQDINQLQRKAGVQTNSTHRIR